MPESKFTPVSLSEIRAKNAEITARERKLSDEQSEAGIKERHVQRILAKNEFFGSPQFTREMAETVARFQLETDKQKAMENGSDYKTLAASYEEEMAGLNSPGKK